MIALIIGGGGREHALAWKIAQAPNVKKVYVAPGNGGTASETKKIENIPLSDFDELVEFAKKNGVDLTIVGPELPLAQGIVDLFKEHNLKIFGPSKQAAQLESSKDFAKIFMAKHGIPTDKFDNFNRNIEKNAITFKGAFDRVYSNTSNDCYIEDEKFNRVITIKKSNSNSTVIWTPGKDNAIEMGDMGEKDEWRRMVCVETANTLENSIVVYPQLSHSIATEYSVHDY